MSSQRHLLDPDEPPAFEVVRERGASQFFLLCDHASRQLPRALGTLGLDAAALEAHIAWDIGAAQLARRVSEALDAPLVLAGYSRLAIDCNRPLEVTASVPAITCEIRVPGNEGLSEEGRRARQDELFWPYHRAIERALAARDASGHSSTILSLHSFTPSLYGKDRPWHVGVMYGRDRRFAGALFASLREEAAAFSAVLGEPFVVGDNEPYRVTDGTDYGVPMYAERQGRLGLLLEVRQDLIATASGVERMLAPLVRAFERVDADAIRSEKTP